MEAKQVARLVVIDDIRSVVEMIATKIPWAEHGIEVVGTARDGLEGMALIEASRPDIVVTDIRMPKMDGLEMTERILGLLPDCKIVILSGYTDFEYARKAMQLGATDFIKKPFTMQDMVAVALKAKAQWLEAKQQRDSLEQLQKQVKASLPALRQEYMGRLLQYPSSREKALELWRFLELDLPSSKLTVMIVEIDDYERKYANAAVQQIELVHFSLQNILEETAGKRVKCALVRETSRRFALIADTADRTEAVRIAEACCRHIEQYTKFTVSIGIGSPADALTDLPESYRQARTALSYHFYTGGNAALHYDTVRSQPSARAVPIQPEEAFVFALQAGNRDAVLDIIGKQVDSLEKLRPYPDPEQTAGVLILWATTIYKSLLEWLPEAKTRPLGERVRQLRHSPDLTLQRFAAVLTDIAEEGCRLVLEERRRESQKVVSKAIEYIRTHIGDELTVDRCAKVVSLSGGYFANLFKKETGQTFNQFVTHERLERAKKMLAQNVPVQDIALELGYEHRRYFSDVFKKHTGLTPSEFKERHYPAAGEHR